MKSRVCKSQEKYVSANFNNTKYFEDFNLHKHIAIEILVKRKKILLLYSVFQSLTVLRHSTDTNRHFFFFWQTIFVLFFFQQENEQIQK